MARFTAPLLLLLLAGVVAACGADGSASGGDEPASGDGRPGRLVVHKTLGDGPVFIEGSLTHLRITRQDDVEIVDEVRQQETLDDPVFDGPLAEGTYELTTVERPCSGNCEHLDPPAEDTRCSVKLEIAARRTTRATIVLGPTGECSTGAPGSP